MHITVVTPASVYVLPEVEAEVPEAFAELTEWVPVSSTATHWHALFNEQLSGVFHQWFSGPSFSGKSRRAYEKKNNRVRSLA